MFSERTVPALSSIAVSDARGNPYQTGRPELAVGDPLTLVVPVRPLARGVYTVRWRVDSAVDGHATTGAYEFGVQVAAFRRAGDAAYDQRARHLDPRADRTVDPAGGARGAAGGRDRRGRALRGLGLGSTATRRLRLGAGRHRPRALVRRAAAERGLLARCVAALAGRSRAHLARSRDRRSRRRAVGGAVRAADPAPRAGGRGDRRAGGGDRARRQWARGSESVAIGSHRHRPGRAFRGGRCVDRWSRSAPDRHPRRALGREGRSGTPLLDRRRSRSCADRGHRDRPRDQRASRLGRARDDGIREGGAREAGAGGDDRCRCGTQSQSAALPSARSDLAPLRRGARVELVLAAAALAVAALLGTLAPPLAGGAVGLPGLEASGTRRRRAPYGCS